MTTQEFTHGLRLLADWYDEHPDVPLPYHGGDTSWQIYAVTGPNQKEQMATIAKAMGTAEKSVDDTFFKLTKHFGTIELQALSYRNQVCTAKVVGKKEIEVEKAVKWEKELKTVDVVEWECPESLLAGLNEESSDDNAPEPIALEADVPF